MTVDLRLTELLIIAQKETAHVGVLEWCFPEHKGLYENSYCQSTLQNQLYTHNYIWL